MTKINPPWWQSAIGYQIYPRSFQDTNHDGIGDLQGIIKRLPYLKWLGIDFIWLNPIYTSPNVDNGYDIADFQNIASEYGTLSDFKTLIAAAHKQDIRVIMDLVVNHTSNQHAWFKAAKTSRTNPYHDFYIWQPNYNHQPPNNWTNFTGDSVWTYNQATDEWYFHLFAPEQPDLNWENPSVQTEIINMITWWSEQNIDGFRLDALSHLKKVSFETPQPTGEHQFDIFANNPGIEKFLKRLHDTFKSLHLMTVGEAGGVHADTARNWTGPQGFIDMIFELEHQSRQSDVPPRADINHLLSSLTTWEEQLNSQGWLGIYLENHDQPRSLTVYGDNNPLAAKSLATLLLTLRGTPFIYQGEELGMINMPFTSPDQIDDPPTYHDFQRFKSAGIATDLALKKATSWSRDNARTPMQWTKFGFSDNAADSKKTWLVTNPNTTTCNYQEDKENPDSILNYYRRLIDLRRHDDTLKSGDFKLITMEKTNILVFTRNSTDSQRLIVINLSDTPQTISLPEQLLNKGWQPLIATINPIPEISQSIHLQPFQSIIWYN